MSSKQKNWQKRRDHYANQYFINAGNYKTFCDHVHGIRSRKGRTYESLRKQECIRNPGLSGDPCVIVNAFQVEYTPEVQKGLILAVMAAVVIHLLYLLLTAILKHPLHLNVIERATAIYSNAGILVIPLVQVLLGQEYVIYSSAFITVQLVLLWTHCKSMLCEESKLEWKKILLNVNIISIFVGVILSCLRVSLPSGVQSVLRMMNNLMGPLGMLLAEWLLRMFL